MQALEEFQQHLEKVHREHPARRMLFRVVAGSAAYAHIVASVLLAFGAYLGRVRPHLALLPLVCLALESFFTALLALGTGLRVAAKAEICQIWRQVLTTNLGMVIAAGWMSAVGASAFRDGSNGSFSGAVTVPVAITLASIVCKQILLTGHAALGVISATALLALLLGQLHKLGTVHSQTVAALAPGLIAALLVLSVRDLTNGIAAERWGQAGCFGSAVVGYAVLLLPATELLLGTDDEHWAELRTGAAVPVGLLALSPYVVDELGKWAEDVAYGFLIV